ncbi:uncharacterized protein [Miscanthus floridulus]|uniref:uncharacterized protein n=1 Tax=Miscanthus floridulus TaxID=154761 RepID=UPI00345B2581
MEAKRPKHDGGVSQPEDIVFDVLARLPTKVLCRLRCVCKGWRDLISDPAFVAEQRSRAADPHLVGVFNGARCGLPEVRVMDMDGNVVKTFEITRGTSLPPQLPTRPALIFADGRDGGMIINPAAGRAFGTSDPIDWLKITTYINSLGRANPSGVFKVVRLHEPDDNDGDGTHQLCEVATILDGHADVVGSSGDTEPLTWRQRSAPPIVIDTCWSYNHKAVVNGVVYFMTDELDEDDDVGPSRIAAFDLESKEWKAEVINGPALGLDHDKEEEIQHFALVELREP